MITEERTGRCGVLTGVIKIAAAFRCARVTEERTGRCGVLTGISNIAAAFRCARVTEELGPRVFRNAGWLTAAYLSSRGASLLWQLLLARLLTRQAQVYGKLGILISLSAIFQILAECGLNMAAQQEWPKGNLSSSTLLGLLGALRLATSTVSAALLVLTVLLLYGPGEIAMAALPVALSLFAAGMMQSPIGVWESRQEMRTIAVLGVIQTTVLIPLQIVALRVWGSLIALAVAIAFSSIAASGTAWSIAVASFGWPALPPAAERRRQAREFLRLGAPVMLSSLVFVIYYRVDAVLLSKWKNDEAAGVFVIATLLFMGLVDATWSQLGRALFPKMSELWGAQCDAATLRQTFRPLHRMYLGFSIAILIASIAFGKQAFALVFSAHSPWLQAWAPFTVLCFGYWPVVLYGLLYRCLLLSGQRTVYVLTVLGATAVKFTAARLLIPLYGPAGAAVSNACSQVFMTGLTLVAVNRTWSKAVSWRTIGAYAGVMLVLAGWWAVQTGR